MSRIIFITGTDTGVGKTVVTAALLRSLLDRGIDAAAFKPVQTGCGQGDDDVQWIRTMAGVDENRAIRQLYRLTLPASPHLAAREEGVVIDAKRIIATIHDLSKKHETLLVEGAGGLLVPLDERHTILDLITASGAEVVLVSRNALGTINHTGLTLRELRRHDLRLSCVAMNETSAAESEEDQIIRADNLAVIGALAQPANVIPLPYEHDLTPQAIQTLAKLFADT